MRQRTVAAVAAAASLLVVLAGCSAGGTSSGGDTAATITFTASDDPSAYTAVIKQFEKQHPKITVKYSQIPFANYDSTIQQRLTAKDTSLDVVAVDQPRMAQLAAQGVLKDLSDVKSELKPKISSSQYDISIYNGKLWAAPLSNSTQLLYYNKDALQKAGGDTPTASPDARWTWEKLLTSAQAAQKTGTQYGLLFEQPSAYYEIEPLIVSAGGKTGITGKDALTADVNNAGWKKALSWYGNLYSSGVSARGLADFQTNTAFTSGKAAYFVGGPWDLSQFSKTSFDWGVAPLPYFEGGKASSPNGSWSLAINAASKQSGDAETFIRYMTMNTKGATLANSSAGNMPSNTAAQSTYLDGLDSAAGSRSAGAKQIITYEAAKTATARPVSVGYPQFEDAVNKALGDIVNGSAVDARLEQLQATITRSWQNLK